MMTADHPNAVWLAQIYRGSTAIENDPSLDQEARKSKIAEHHKLMFSRLAPNWTIHSGGIRLAATGDAAFATAMGSRRKTLTNGSFRPIEIDQILADDSYGILHVRCRAERRGIAAEWVAIGVWRFENGLAVEHWELPPGDQWDQFFLADDPDFNGTAREFWLKK